MKSPYNIRKEAVISQTVPQPPEPMPEAETQSAEESLEAAEAHDHRRESGHSRKNERHLPGKSNRVNPPAKT